MTMGGGVTMGSPPHNLRGARKGERGGSNATPLAGPARARASAEHDTFDTVLGGEKPGFSASSAPIPASASDKAGGSGAPGSPGAGGLPGPISVSTASQARANQA